MSTFHCRVSMLLINRSRTAVYLLIALLICGLLLGAVYVERLNENRLEAEARSEVQKHLLTVRERLETRLVSDLQLARGLVAAVAINPQLNQTDFERAARSLFSPHSQLRNIGAAPDMVIRMMYPLQGNEKAIGLDYRNNPAQFEAAERARISRSIVLAGPVKLVQGGTGLIARMPAYLHDNEGNEYFWGMVSAVIDDQQLLKNSGLLDADLPIEVAIRGKDGLGADGEVFFGRAELFDEQPMVSEILLPGGYWQLAAVPRSGFFTADTYTVLVRAGYGLVALLLLFAFGLMARALRSASKAQVQAESTQALLSDSLKALHSREALLRTVIDEMPDVVALKDNQGNFLLSNEAVARLYKTSPAAMVGKSDADFGVPAELADAMRQNVLDVIANGTPEVVFEDSLDAATGEIRHFKSIKKPFRDANGDDQLLVIAHDITDIVETRKQLEESERKLLTILDNVDAYIYLKDTEGRYQFANRPVRELWDSEMEDIVGFGDESFFDEATTANIVRNDRTVLVHGQVLRTEETNRVPATGNVTTFQSTKLPLRREDGSIYGLCGISIDISERKRIERSLRESEQRFKVAGMAAYDLIYEWSVADNTLQWFGDVDRILGYKAGEVSGDLQAWFALVHPEDLDTVADRADLHRNSTTAIQFDYRIQHRDGSYRYWSDHALPLFDEDSRPYKWIGVCTDITDQKEQQSRLEYTAYHDMLTNLPNRALLSDRLRQAIQQQDMKPLSLAVVYIDLDGFKEINDSYGHEIGDRFLIAISKRFNQVLREGDTIARLGGDEFVAVLVDVEDSAATVPLLKQFLQLISQPVQLDDLILQASASLGVTFYPQAEAVDEDLLLRQADQAMYQAKLAGKNRYYFFDTEHDRSVRGRSETLERIRAGLANNEFALFYQPKVNMRTGDVVGVEALIRWLHPEEGVIPPGLFLPVIEDHPLALDVGRWVINTALAQMEYWQNLGLDIPVSVNIGALQLQQTDFVECLQQLLTAHPDVHPSNLELEVLETSALADMSQVSQIMSDCQAIGVSFALDDFGTGYSSLAYLKHLPAAVLKIDRSFVRDMLVDPDDRAILEGIMGMAAAFRRDVIAEGVEEIEHGELLLQLGCELAQGYVIARPMPANELPGWIAGWQPPEQWRQVANYRSTDVLSAEMMG